MDEYERLEEELQRIYEDYMMKFRNMSYLEQTYEEYNRVEQDKFEARTINNFKEKDQSKLWNQCWIFVAEYSFLKTVAIYFIE